MKEREDIIKSLEWANLTQRESGMCEVTFATLFVEHACFPMTREILSGVVRERRQESQESSWTC